MRALRFIAFGIVTLLLRSAASAQENGAVILTPAPSPAPRVNGPSVFGVRPGSPFLYRIPATGVRPMEFAADNLPAGLSLDKAAGEITGSLASAGTTEVLLRARNAAGTCERKFRIVAGEAIALTPAMGWNSWNCWAKSVDQGKVERAARAMAASGLADHGWTYVNIDDAWQGKRTGGDHALQGNEKFPDMKGLCDSIHALGLKAGIYSTPWIVSYAGYAGGSSDRADGAWSAAIDRLKDRRFGRHSFARADARQWAAWGFDYLKYDWKPNDVPHVAEMASALRASGRDIVFSLSNAAPFSHATDWARLANSWRTTGDIRDIWADLRYFGVSEIGFSQDKWAPYAGPGHWNDPDMLVVGRVGWSANLHPTRLSADEQYSHISLWCLLSAPLLLGCDLERLDAFTLSLLTNDEVLALDQDSLGRQAVRVASAGPVDVFMKDLEDGSEALGFFNRGSESRTIAFGKLRQLGLGGPLHVRDLWRQKDLPDIADPDKEPLSMTIPAHGVMLYKIAPALLAGALLAPYRPIHAALPKTIELWPEGVPGLRADASPEKIQGGRAWNVHHPYVEVYPAPAEKAVGTAMVLCPGGGYTFLAVEHNGTVVARWLNARGVTAFVLHYRLAEYGYPASLRDVLRAMRIVRSRAAEFGVKPDRIGIFGASAGGHLAACAATMYDDPEGKTGAAFDAVSARPDFVALLYPVITMTGPYRHPGSVKALLGDHPAPGVAERVSAQLRVTKDTPPAFIVQTQEDGTVPVQNSLMFYEALNTAHVPVEMHLWVKGKHGFGMDKGVGEVSTWPDRWEQWLRANGWLTPPAS